MNSYRINASQIAGQGAFSSRSILKNEIVGLAFMRERDTGNPDNDYVRTELGRFVNHSDTPNMQLIIEGKNLYFVAVKDMETKEELTINYHQFPWEGKRKF